MLFLPKEGVPVRRLLHPRVTPAEERTHVRVPRIVAVLALVVGTTILAPAAGAAAAPCRVTNATTLAVYTGSGSNLQTAIDAAAPGTTLRIGGACVGNFIIGKNLRLVGHPTPAHPAATLDGNAAGTVLTINAGTVALKDLMITNGSSIDIGGGIHNAGTLTLLGSCSVTGNMATGGTDTRLVGAGIYNAGTLTLKDSSSVTQNTTGNIFSTGGGIYNAGTLTLMGSSSVAGNRATNGGGIYSYHATLTLKGASSVSGNTASDGGGIYNIGNFATVTMNGSSSVSGNTAPSGHAGGIYNVHGMLVLNSSSSVAGNSGLFEGGGIYNNDATLTMNDSSSVSGNADDQDGGGIFNDRGTATLNDASSVTDNSATNGGGIDNRDGLSTLTLNGSSSVTGNTATGTGGGIFNHSATFNACNTWTGVISPNDPDDPPTPTVIVC